MNNGQVNFAKTQPLEGKTDSQTVTIPLTGSCVTGSTVSVQISQHEPLKYPLNPSSPFKRPPADPPLRPTEKINEMVEQSLEMSIEEQNLLLSLLHKNIADQREAKIKELVLIQKQYENALNFFNKFK